jgi:hypothetical protein
MSQINTNGINTNYPEPGTNNSSQGFRDNFSQIRTNLDTASNEITDLQNKVVVKTALNGTVLNNDMANTLISNASTSGFRATTYNLGNALSGTVLVDVNRADVQYGAVTGNVTLQFGGWAPTNTESNVVLRLTVANVDAVISLPNAAVSANNNFGVTTLENYQDISGTATLTAPSNVSILEYTFSTLDCGNTVSVAPNNRPFQATQIINRDPAPTGLPGDVVGTVAVGNSVGELNVTSTIGTGNYIIVGSTSGLYTELPIVFTGNTDAANSNITAGTTYYVSTVANATAFTVSTAASGSELNVGTSSQAFNGNPISYLYVCTDTFDSTIYPKTVGNTFSGNLIQMSTTNNLAVDAPLIFTGNVDTANTNLVANTVYYIKTIVNVDAPLGNITISATRTSGTAGSTFAVGAKANLTINANAYIGTDVWKRVALTTW